MQRAVTLVWVLILAICSATWAQPLKGRALENVEAFTRLLGYVRYFHPSDQVAETDWEAFASQHILTVEGARNARELATMLNDLFQPYAPTLRVYPLGVTPELPRALRQPGTAKEVVMWAHIPLGSGEANLLAPGERLQVPLRGGRVPEHVPFTGGDGLRRLPEPLRLKLPKPSEPLTLALGGGVCAALPLTLYVDEAGTLPHVEVPAPLASPSAPPSDRGARLATVALAWNVFQHFFSYWDTVDTDWRASLRAALQKAAVDTSGQDFLVTLEQLMDGLRDGHTRTYHPTYSEMDAYSAPFTIDRVEGELIVTTVVSNNPTRIRPGDTVLELNGRSAEEALQATLKRVSGVGQWGRYLALNRLLGNDDSQPINVTLAPYGGGPPYQVEYTPRKDFRTDLREERPPVVSQLAPNILYVDLTRVEERQFTNVVRRLEKAKGIVFDVRGYPTQFAYNLLAHLTREPLQTAPFLMPVVVRPDYQAMHFVDVTPVWARPQRPYLTDNLAFIINGNGAISYAESIMGLIERHNIGARVGKSTAGANGNIVSLELPGGYRTSWTGLKVTKVGGEPLFTVGVTPTIPAERTKAGVAAGRDELLERAFEVVSGQDASAIRPRAVSLPPPAPSPITLVPISPAAGVRTVRPAEWQQVQPGVFVRQETTGDVAALLVRVQTDTPEEVLRSLREETNLQTDDLKAAGDLEVGAFTWQLFQFLTSGGGVSWRGTVAVARAADRTLLVLIQAPPDAYNRLHEEVFLPVLERFEIRE